MKKKKKKQFKNNPHKVFITEDLTKSNHKLVKIVMEQQYERKSIFGFWTRDGNIFVKGRKDDNPIRDRTRGEIMKLLRNLKPPAAHDPTNETNSMETST